VIPPISIPLKHIDTIHQYNRKIAIEFYVVGLMNIQYAIHQDTVYVLEANPRASRTVPLVSKVCNIPMARIATQVMLGKKLSELGLGRKSIPHFGVKEAVFPFSMYHEVDPLLGPEMRSTGEVLGLADSFGLAFFKAQQAAQAKLPEQGTVLISVANDDKPAVVEVARRFAELNFSIKATKGTYDCLATAGIAAEPILKMHEGRPNIVDAITDGEVHLVINTPGGKESKQDDSYIRKTAVKRKVPYITTLAAGLAAAKGIEAFREGRARVKSLQEYHVGIR
jgi:carbamoyl-phosphate synthase large subunit